jgi:hypothetical protein
MIDPTITPTSNIAMNPLPKSGEYVPSEDEKKLIAETRQRRDQMRQSRQPHEMQWFVNHAMLRGQQFVEYSVKDSRVVNIPVSPRERHAINRIRPKIVARRAKLVKNKVRIFVTPATAEQEDRLNARATQRALDYIWRRDGLEQKRRKALMKAETEGRGYWWIHHNPSKIGYVLTTDPLTGEKTRQEAEIGDVEIEVGGAYEVLVGDPSIPTIGDQPEIMRIRMRPIEDMKVRYPDHAMFIKGGGGQSSDDWFRYEKQMANLNSSGTGGFTDAAKKSVNDWVMVTEHFVRPCGKYPKGHYRVLVGDILVKNEDELPYGFYDLPNPYPVEEFVDIPSASQYWNTTLIEQLTPLQREYNTGRSKLVEHIKKAVHPKVIVFKQHRLPEGAWNDKAGEIIELFHTPGLPQPIVVTPQNLAGDIWRVLEMVRQEFDDISQVYPSAEGKSGGATSGFQTNLLQEATDMVHRPDVEAIDTAVENAMVKVRRIMKFAYDVPRLIAAIGRNMEADAQEFFAEQIDEAADLKVESGSALPDMRAQRMQIVKEMYDGQMFGPLGAPEAVRKAFSLMELGGVDEAIDSSKIDENLARIENNDLTSAKPVANPEFFHNHQIHYEVHTEMLKSPETRTWPPEQKQAALIHLIAHLDFFDPAAALNAALQYGLPPPPQALALQQKMQMGMGQPTGPAEEQINGTTGTDNGQPAGN